MEVPDKEALLEKLRRKFPGSYRYSLILFSSVPRAGLQVHQGRGSALYGLPESIARVGTCASGAGTAAARAWLAGACRGGLHSGLRKQAGKGARTLAAQVSPLSLWSILWLFAPPAQLTSGVVYTRGFAPQGAEGAWPAVGSNDASELFNSEAHSVSPAF